jgi:hypothetical protein
MMMMMMIRKRGIKTRLIQGHEATAKGCAIHTNEYKGGGELLPEFATLDTRRPTYDSLRELHASLAKKTRA